MAADGNFDSPGFDGNLDPNMIGSNMFGADGPTKNSPLKGKVIGCLSGRPLYHPLQKALASEDVLDWNDAVCALRREKRQEKKDIKFQNRDEKKDAKNQQALADAEMTMASSKLAAGIADSTKSGSEANLNKGNGDEKPSNTGLYIGIGVGVLVLGVIGFVVYRRMKK